jgi:hypothetical protein
MMSAKRKGVDNDLNLAVIEIKEMRFLRSAIFGDRVGFIRSSLEKEANAYLHHSIFRKRLFRVSLSLE